MKVKKVNKVINPTTAGPPKQDKKLFGEVLLREIRWLKTNQNQEKQ